MDEIDRCLLLAMTQLQAATPNPTLWGGLASSSLAQGLEKLAGELQNLRVRLESWVM
jgi:hypothetical protein